MDQEAKTELMSIVDGLSPKARTSIASLREDQVIRLHFGLGMYIRNQIRQGRLPALFRWSRTQVPGGIKHFDDVTFPILVEVWRLVNASSNTERRQDLRLPLLQGAGSTGGWTVGGGLEYALTNHWTAFVEYDHIGLPAVTVPFPTVPVVNTENISVKQTVDLFKVGVNYKFDLAALIGAPN